MWLQRHAVRMSHSLRYCIYNSLHLDKALQGRIEVTLGLVEIDLKKNVAQSEPGGICGPKIMTNRTSTFPARRATLALSSALKKITRFVKAKSLSSIRDYIKGIEL